MQRFSRRSFLGALPCVALAGVLAFPTAAGANPAAFTAATTMLQLMNSFSKPGNGMGAMMNAQFAMLGVISEQLNSIQSAIVDLRNDVARLPDEMRKVLVRAQRDDLLSKMASCASLYRQRASASLGIPGYFEQENIKADLRFILQQASFVRGQLERVEDGSGPEASMIAPLGLALEVACQGHLVYNRADLRVTCAHYTAWIDRMLADGPGSIAWRQAEAVKRHDAAIAEFENVGLAKDLRLGNFRIAGSQIGEEAADPCIVLFEFEVVGEQANGYLPPPIGWSFGDKTPYFGAGQRILGQIKLAEDKQLGVMLLEYVRAEPKFFSAWGGNPVAGASDWPTKTEKCYRHDHRRERAYTPEQVRAAINGPGSRVAVNDHARAQLEVAIARVNSCRAEIGMCGLASVVASQSRKQIEDVLRVIA